MENILLVIDGARMDRAMVDFSCYLAKLTRSRLRALFMEHLSIEGESEKFEIFGSVSSTMVLPRELHEKQKILQVCESNEKLFAETCISNGIDFSIRSQYHNWIELLVEETRFADVMVINPQTSFSDKVANIPSNFAKQVLEKAECPVIIAPGSFEGVDQLLFAYDGSKSCVFAIKQFAHTFPQLTGLPVTLLQIGTAEDAFANDSEKVNELLDAHFPNHHFELLEGSPSNELFGYLLGKRNVFIVMGAYGRNNISRFFRQSTADLVMKTINLPFFISHA
ncbi:universal stress protein [Chitinophagaceae bacterium 26-R-25]|nr:universal stress protein [Chitinophagaceae bacterium 26-R-25]